MKTGTVKFYNSQKGFGLHRSGRRRQGRVRSCDRAGSSRHARTGRGTEDLLRRRVSTAAAARIAARTCSGVSSTDRLRERGTRALHAPCAGFHGPTNSRSANRCGFPRPRSIAASQASTRSSPCFRGTRRLPIQGAEHGRRAAARRLKECWHLCQRSVNSEGSPSDRPS